MSSPKIDFKMLVLPCVIMFQKKIIDLTDPNILHILRITLASVAVAILGLYFILWKLVERSESKRKSKKIWVPPKAAAALPFLPQPEAPKAADFTETTYEEHEVKLIREAAQSILFSCGVAFLMSMKFNIHISLLIQTIMIPLNVWDFPVFQKYFIGVPLEKALYDELLEAPAGAQPVTASNDDDDDDNAPRVEELPDDSTTTTTKSKTEETTANVNDID